MDAQLCVKKKISQCNGTRILPGKRQSTVRGFLTVHSNINDITTCIYDYMVLFYLHYNFTKTDDLVTFSSVYFEPDVRL